MLFWPNLPYPKLGYPAPLRSIGRFRRYRDSAVPNTARAPIGSNPGLLTPETPEIVTLKFGRINPRRPYDRSLTHYYHRYTHNPRHYPEYHHHRYAHSSRHHREHYPGHYPRERIGRIDRIWGLILGGVGGSSPIAFPSILVDYKYQKNQKNKTF